MSKFYLYIGIVNLLDLVGMTSGKLWSLYGNPIYLILCTLGLAGAGFFFALSLKFEGLAVTSILWIAVSGTLITLTGYYVFHESLSRWQVVGILMVLGGVILLDIH